MIEPNTIYNEDCLLSMSRMPDRYVDMILTSPPYDSMRSYQGFEFNFEGVAKESSRVLKVGGVIVWVVADQTVKGSETGTSFRQALYFMDKCKLNLHDTMIYEKSGFNFPANNRYHQIFEYMFVFSKGAPKTFNAIKDRKNVYPGQVTHSFHRTKDGKKDMSIVKAKPAEEYGMRFNIWRYKTGGGQISQDKVAHSHPAIFPERLAEDSILSWSNQGDLVYDPMNGSGTTTKMAKLLGRNYIGSEITQEYCQIAEQRLNYDISRI